MGKTGTTGKTGQPPWAKRILKLLEQAKAKDPDFVRFGAYSHKYKLSAPASEEMIQKFEEQEGIRLPGGFRLLMDEGRWKEWKQQNGFGAVDRYFTSGAV